MKSITSSGKTDEEKKEEYQKRIGRHLGGGQFSKIPKI